MKKEIIILSIACLIISNILVSNAATYNYYGGNVSKYSDFETSCMTKETRDAYATNLVSDMRDSQGRVDPKVECWVERSNGDNITQKIQYDDNKTNNYMIYYYFSSNVGKAVKLNIGLQLPQFRSVEVRGYWNPDYFTF